MRVDDNAFYAGFYNRFDWLIRFIYCKVPLVRDVLRAIMYRKLYASDTDALDQQFEKLHSVLGPRGFMLHKVYLRDHYNFNRPPLFLKNSKPTWNRNLTHEGNSYTDRLRADDILYTSATDGFTTCDALEAIASSRLHVVPTHQSFRGRDHIKLVATLIAWKQKDIEIVTGEHSSSGDGICAS